VSFLCADSRLEKKNPLLSGFVDIAPCEMNARFYTELPILPAVGWQA
jgi:hypothetical protein